ncbi:unnamed protein product, partial [Heterotrigona itama]
SDTVLRTLKIRFFESMILAEIRHSIEDPLTEVQ